MWAETVKFLIFCITSLLLCSMAINFIKFKMFINKIKSTAIIEKNNDEKTEEFKKVINEEDGEVLEDLIDEFRKEEN